MIFGLMALAQKLSGYQNKPLAKLLTSIGLVLLAIWLLWFLPRAIAFGVIYVLATGLVTWAVLHVRSSSSGTQTRFSEECKAIVKDEFARFTRAERVAICCIAAVPMREQTLRERLEARGFAWNSDIPANLERELVSRDFDGLFYILSDYQSAVQELCPRQNTGILTINTGGFKH